MSWAVPALSPGPNLQHDVTVIFWQWQVHWRLRLVQNFQSCLTFMFVQNLAHRTQTSTLPDKCLFSYNHLKINHNQYYTQWCLVISIQHLFVSKSKHHCCISIFWCMFSPSKLVQGLWTWSLIFLYSLFTASHISYTEVYKGIIKWPINNKTPVSNMCTQVKFISF